MKSIHGVGELMTQVVLRGGGLLPATTTSQPEGDVVKTQTEPEREDIMVMDTKLKIIEILQVALRVFLLQTKHLPIVTFFTFSFSLFQTYGWTTGSPACSVFLNTSLMRTTHRETALPPIMLRVKCQV